MCVQCAQLLHQHQRSEFIPCRNTHWTTHQLQLLREWNNSSASFQVNPMYFKSFGMMSCQFFQLLFVLLKFQFKACFGILQSSNLITCRSHLVSSLIICSSFASSVLFLTSTLLTLSCHFIPNNSRKIHTVLHQAVVIIFPLRKETIIIAQTWSNRGWEAMKQYKLKTDSSTNLQWMVEVLQQMTCPSSLALTSVSTSQSSCLPRPTAKCSYLQAIKSADCSLWPSQVEISVIFPTVWY